MRPLRGRSDEARQAFPMIFGIGVDVVQISRIASIWNRWGDRFLQRVFTKQEIEYCLLRKNPSPHLAARFAAKEAFLKALGTGYAQGVRWKDIEIIRNSSARPKVELHSRTRTLCQSHGVDRIHISMSHDGDYGLGQVILEV